MIPEYEVFAVQYATAQRTGASNFLLPRDSEAVMPIAFFFWVIRRGDKVVVVDTGFSDQTGRRRNREVACPPEKALAALGLEPGDVGDVILTHLHYDHTGNLGLFERARIHVQRAELEFATGRSMRHAAVNHFYEVEDVKRLVGEIYRGRVELQDGDCELYPGISTHLVGGHTAGLQVVRVRTARGWLVLASDAAHFGPNLRERNPFPALTNLPQVLEAYGRVEALADGLDNVVPGHDPSVLQDYPLLAADGVAIALLHERSTMGTGRVANAGGSPPVRGGIR